MVERTPGEGTAAPERLLRDLVSALEARDPGWILLEGPAGTGKSTLLADALERSGGILFHAAPLTEHDLLEDFQALLRREFGRLPKPEGPGVLPDPGGVPGWANLLLGLVDEARRRGGVPLVIAFDGWPILRATRRRLEGELARALERAADRRAPVHFVLVDEGSGALEGSPLPPPQAVLRTGALSFRAAARAQGGREPWGAFLRWACLGGDPAHLPVDGAGMEWDETVRRRVLSVGGDLHDRPLALLTARYQRPARYASLLRALAEGARDWASLRRRARGIESGGQMAPYLQRLEADGFIRTERPLGARPNSRNRRYRIRDPFLAFWFACVLPERSVLARTRDPELVWREGVRPRLETHLGRWLPVAVEEWFVHHADERLPAPAREVGGVWGDDTEFQVVGWLTNGQICYVSSRWSREVSSAEVFEELKGDMARTRYGIGRQARTPVLVLPGGADPELRRRIAGDPLALTLDMEDLMGRFEARDSLADQGPGASDG